MSTMNTNQIGLASVFIEEAQHAVRKGYRPSLLDVMAHVAGLISPHKAPAILWNHLKSLASTEVRELPWWLGTTCIGLLSLLWPLTWILFVPLHWSLFRLYARALDRKKEAATT